MNALALIDHLVYAAPDLEDTVDELEHRYGVRAMPGGQHPGRGTRNALLALSPTSYLEIVGPDREQEPPETSRWFGIDGLTKPALVTWAAKASDLDALVARAASRGLRLGPVAAGRRARLDGEILSWKFTDPVAIVADGLVPFFIDWGASAHPAASAPRGPSLVSLRAEHPDPEGVRAALAALDIGLTVSHGPRARLVATLEAGGRAVELD